MLDYAGDASETGKNVGDDLREGKTTLPLILAMQRGTAAQSDLVRDAIEAGDTAQLPQDRRHRARNWRPGSFPRGGRRRSATRN